MPMRPCPCPCSCSCPCPCQSVCQLLPTSRVDSLDQTQRVSNHHLGPCTTGESPAKEQMKLLFAADLARTKCCSLLLYVLRTRTEAVRLGDSRYKANAYSCLLKAAHVSTCLGNSSACIKMTVPTAGSPSHHTLMGRPDRSRVECPAFARPQDPPMSSQQIHTQGQTGPAT